MSEWISVEERLPENMKDVLITDGENISIGRSNKNHFQQQYWYSYIYDHVKHKDITHWMPLPQPPQIDPYAVTELN